MKLIITCFLLIVSSISLFSQTQFGLRADSLSLNGVVVFSDAQNNIKLLAGAERVSAMGAGAADQGYAIYDLDVDPEDLYIILKKSIVEMDKKDFDVSLLSSTKFFKNRDNEYVIISNFAKAKHGYGQYPKIIKFNSNLKKTYEFVDTSSSYPFLVSGYSTPIALLSDESFLSSEVKFNKDYSKQHVTLSKFDRLGHFQKSIEMMPEVFDTTTSDEKWNGVRLEAHDIKAQDNFVYLGFSRQLYKNGYTSVIHPMIAKFDLDGHTIWKNQLFEDFSNGRSYDNSYIMEPKGDSIIAFGKIFAKANENPTGKKGQFAQIIDKNTGKQIKYIEFGDDFDAIISHAIRTVDGGYLCVGHTEPKVKSDTMENTYDNYTIKLDKDFKMIWSYIEPSSGETDKYYDLYNYVMQFNEKTYLAIGSMDSLCIGRFFKDKSAGGVEINNEQNATYSIYRNNDETICKIDLKKGSNLTIELYNISGERLSAMDYGYVSEGEAEYRIDDKSLPSGVYFVAVKLNNSKLTMKYAK
jgi:hypothetical protein